MPVTSKPLARNLIRLRRDNLRKIAIILTRHCPLITIGVTDILPYRWCMGAEETREVWQISGQTSFNCYRSRKHAVIWKGCCASGMSRDGWSKKMIYPRTKAQSRCLVRKWPGKTNRQGCCRTSEGCNDCQRSYPNLSYPTL